MKIELNIQLLDVPESQYHKKFYAVVRDLTDLQAGGGVSPSQYTCFAESISELLNAIKMALIERSDKYSELKTEELAES